MGNKSGVINKIILYYVIQNKSRFPENRKLLTLCLFEGFWTWGFNILTLVKFYF